MNEVVALLLAVGAICNNVNGKETCTKAVIQCTEDRGYTNLPTQDKKEALLKYCVNKELGIKEKSNGGINP